MHARYIVSYLYTMAGSSYDLRALFSSFENYTGKYCRNLITLYNKYNIQIFLFVKELILGAAMQTLNLSSSYQN